MISLSHVHPLWPVASLWVQPMTSFSAGKSQNLLECFRLAGDSLDFEGSEECSIVLEFPFVGVYTCDFFHLQKLQNSFIASLG